MYSPILTKPMEEELTRLGVKELKTAEDVDMALKENKESTLLVINSVCGCSAGSCRPAIRLALRNQKLPEKLYTVFAGVDGEATQRARSYFSDYPPSSPSIVVMKDGKVTKMIARQDIEGRSPEMIAEDLVNAFNSL